MLFRSIKNPAKITCFKCKVEGHHVRDCPMKKKNLSEKQLGKRPLVQSRAQPHVEQRSPPKKTQVIAPQVEEPIKKKKSRCCYLCRGQGHFASSCTVGNLSSPVILDEVYSLRKDRSGNVFAKYVGAQSGAKKSTIWVPSLL